MGAINSIMHSTATVLLPVVASLNMIIVVSLVGQSSAAYLKGHSPKGDIRAAQLRLQLAHLALWTISVMIALKLTLPTELADGMISAWVVGQGFALQDTIQSIVAGLVARHNDDLNTLIVKREKPGQVVKYDNKSARVTDCSLLTFTIEFKSDPPEKMVLSWTQVHQLRIVG